jgi:hypothetical protein
METQNLITILDNVGRTILGEVNAELTNDSVLVIKNAVVLHVKEHDGGKVSIQLLPIFFREFFADKTSDYNIFYKKTNISETDITAYDFRLLGQYGQMFNKSNTFVAPTPQSNQGEAENKPSVINLFDE